MKRSALAPEVATLFDQADSYEEDSIALRAAGDWSGADTLLAQAQQLRAEAYQLGNLRDTGGAGAIAMPDGAP